MSMENYMLRENDLERLRELGLAEGQRVTPLFTTLYDYYGRYLLKYLDKKLELSQREKEIMESAVHLKPIKEEEKDAYQSMSPMKFFYIRNNLKIERLSKEDIELLKRRAFEKQEELDEKLEEMIGRTYQEVITNKKYDDGTHINYGPTSSSEFFAPNNFVVLGLRIDPEYEADTKENPNWLDQFFAREALAQLLAKKVMDDAEKVGLPVHVVEYNESTVTRKVTQQEMEEGQVQK